MSRPPDHENDTTPLRFGDPAPERRAPPPLKYDKFDGHPDNDEIDGPPDDPEDAYDEDRDPEPVRKKRKKKKPRDLLERLDRVPEPPWARVPLILLGVGLGLCLIPLIVLVAQAGAKAGALAGVLLFLGVLFQIVVMSCVMFGVGVLFGIDYGPILRTFVKLAAVIAMIDGISGGLALAFYTGCGGLGIIMAIAVSVMVTYALVQSQFELNGFETMVTVMGVMFATTALSAVAAYVFISKMTAKASAAG